MTENNNTFKTDLQNLLNSMATDYMSLALARRELTQEEKNFLNAVKAVQQAVELLENKQTFAVRPPRKLKKDGADIDKK